MERASLISPKDGRSKVIKEDSAQAWTGVDGHFLMSLRVHQSFSGCLSKLYTCATDCIFREPKETGKQKYETNLALKNYFYVIQGKSKPLAILSKS